MHRRWVALVDDENPEDAGIQGYLHLSIAIVGPDDRLKVKGVSLCYRRPSGFLRFEIVLITCTGTD